MTKIIIFQSAISSKNNWKFDRDVRMITSVLQTILDQKFSKFAVIGVSNTLISYLVFIAAVTVLADFAWRGAVSQLLGYGVGTFWSYYWNRKWSFQSKGRIGAEMGRFIATQVICLLLSASLIGILVDILSLAPTPSWIIVTAAIFLLNFALLRRWVFEEVEQDRSFELTDRGS